MKPLFMNPAVRAAFDSLQAEMISALCSNVYQPVRAPIAEEQPGRTMPAHQAVAEWIEPNAQAEILSIVGELASLGPDATPRQLIALNVRAKAWVAGRAAAHAHWYAEEAAQACEGALQ